MRKIFLIIAAMFAVTAGATIRTIELDKNSDIKEILSNDTLTLDSLKVKGYMSHKNLETVAWMTNRKLEYLDFEECDFEANTLPQKGLNPTPYAQEEGTYARVYKTKLKHVILPESLDVIGDYALCNCVKITTLKLPSHMSSIGRYAFSQLLQLRGELVIPEGIKTIDVSSFYFDQYVTSVKLPSTLEEIKRDGISGFVSIKHLDLPEDLRIIRDTGIGAMLGYKGTLTLPASLEILDCYACCNSAMEKVVFKKGCKVKYVGDYCFEACAYLTSVEFSDDIEEIGEGAFGHGVLHEMYSPKSLRIIHKEAFKLCRLLNIVVLSENIQSIEEEAFAECNRLRDVYIKAAVPPMINATAFGAQGMPIEKTLYVPVGAKAAYEAAPVWKDFKEIVEVSQFPSAGVEAVLSDGAADVRVYGTDGAAVIDGDGVGYAVYSADGLQVATGIADGKTEISLPSGLYIVRTSSRATKIAVK